MAFTGIDIFKLLPKTNCKKCGFPTCLAFAMKVAQGQVQIEQCPDVSEEVKAKLKEASMPAIRRIEFGSYSNKLKIGEETVLFRHEKKFFNPTVIALEINDTDSEIDGKIDQVINSSIERVGQIFKIDSIFLRNISKNSDTFNRAIKKINLRAQEIALILGIDDPQIANSALENIKDQKPILFGANEENISQMIEIAKRFKIPLVVSAKGIDGVIKLTQYAKEKGLEELIIHTQSKSAAEILIDNTIIRRAALRKTIKSIGYPIINIIDEPDIYYETVLASLGILKYSSIIVLKEIPKWRNLILFTLKQNIYSDPQVPMQVKQDIYKVGEPDYNSPVIITTNFALTYFLVKGEIENSKVPTWLAIMDCDGLSVLTAWAAGKFSASKIAQFIKESGIEEKLNHRELIIPGYVAMLKGAIEDKLPGWKVIVGTKEASAIPAFLRNYIRSKQ